MADFLFTWKEDQWSHEKLRDLVVRFEQGQTVIEPWLCAAHRQIEFGDRGYLLKQGERPKGIFGVAIVNAPPFKTESFRGQVDDYVPLRFVVLVDPKETLLVTEEELAAFPVSKDQWVPRGSGVRLDAYSARQIDRIIDGRYAFAPVQSGENDTISSKRERLVEVYDRDQALVRDLKKLYSGKCQICGSAPFSGKMGDIAEAHHIEWLSRSGKDTLENMILLCPNHHAAVHAVDPEFDWEKLEFRAASITMPVRLNQHLNIRRPANGAGDN